MKYYNALEWASKFTLRLNAANNTNYIKKCFKQKLFRVKFPTKNSVDACVCLPQEWSQGASETVIFESRFISRPNAAKNYVIIYIKKKNVSMKFIFNFSQISIKILLCLVTNLWSFLTLFLGNVKICVHWVFCWKSYSE